MKNITYLAISLIALLNICSCSREESALPVQEKNEMRRVQFSAHMEEDVDMLTRTGMRTKVIHTWENTKNKNVHLFETRSDNTIYEGEDVTITTEDPYETATFSAGFYTSITVNPTTKASTKSYTYTGIVAQKNSDNKYFIPDVQYTQDLKGNGIDPDADFIVGKSATYSENLSGKTIDFSFNRAVAVSRLAITNIEGTYIESVTINSKDPLTGSAGYLDIDFDKGEANFSDGSNTLKLVLPDSTKKAGTSYVNFISLLGTKYIESVEVVTDEYIYTKIINIDTPFKKGTFLNIALDMTLKEGICTRVENTRQHLKFMRGETVITSDTWDLNWKDTSYVSPSITGFAEGAEVTCESSDPETASVVYSDGTLTVTPIKVGEVTITANASEVGEYEATSSSYILTIINSAEPQPQTLEFSEDTIKYTYGVDTFTKPTLSGAQTTPKYTSDNTDIASVDENNGDVTFTGTKGGNVKITAIVPEGTVGETQYLADTTSYVIVVTIPPAPTEDKTYYKASAVEAGYDYVIVSDGKALAHNMTLDTTVAAAAVTVAEGGSTITASGDSLLWTVVAETDETLLKSGKYHLTNDGKYLSRISGSTKYSRLKVLESTDKAISSNMKYTMWNNDDTKFWNVSTSNSSTTKYYAYLSSDAWVIKTDTPTADVTFYTSRQPQTLSFSETTPEIDIASTTTYSQSVSGSKTSVTYSITTEDGETTDVATINSSTGEVTAAKKGTVKVTATAAGDATYQSGSASYTLTIKNSAATTTTYYKHTKAEVGKSYIIVSNGYALKNNSGSIAAEEVTVKSDQIELEDADAILWTAGTPSSTEYDGLTYSNNGKYLVRSSSTLSLASSVESKYYNFNYTSENYFKSGSNYYIYYSSSDGWKTSTSSGSSKTVTLYCAEKPASYTYTKVTTATTSLADGTYLIVNPDEEKALDGSSSSNTSNTVSVSPASSTITGDYSANEFEIKSTEDGYTIMSASGYLYYKSSSSSSNSKIAYQSSKALFTINTTEKGTDRFCFQSNDDTKYYLYYYSSSSSSSSSYFKFGGSGAPGEDNPGVILYLKNTTK